MNSFTAIFFFRKEGNINRKKKKEKNSGQNSHNS